MRANEKHDRLPSVRVHAVPFDSGPLEDEETVHAADSLFVLLDAEENDAAAR
jgi:hypothetical protein